MGFLFSGTHCRMVAATSLKLEMRPHALTLTRMAQIHDLAPNLFLRSSDWLEHSELGFMHGLISGLNDCAATLNC